MYIPPRELLNTGHLFDWSIQVGFSYEQYEEACQRNNLRAMHRDTYSHNVTRYREALQEYLGVTLDASTGQPTTHGK